MQIVYSTLSTNETNRNCLSGHEEIPDYQAKDNYNDGLNLAGATIAKGMVIYAPKGETFKNITLSSGSVLAYG